MCRHEIVVCRKTGKLSLSSEVQEIKKRRVEFSLGNIARDLISGGLWEEDVENSDETNFLVNIDDKKTLGFKRDQKVKNADVTFVEEVMEMLLRISERENTITEPLFKIFKIFDFSYPM